MDASHAVDLSGLPSMTALLALAQADCRFEPYSREAAKAALAQAVDSARGRMRNRDRGDGVTVDNILQAAYEQLSRERRQRVARVINATGIVLHTGLGRAPLADAAIAAVRAAAGYCNLEFDLESGERGRRGAFAEHLLCEMTGAESALVVNNNAAATLLVLAGLASGREVIVSRGQLVEIGGSYRLPDVMACGGCVMVEVGTTNKTRIPDYAERMSAATALLMHVHCSNYRVVGFAESPGTAELAALRGQSGMADLLVYDDLGSGAMHDDALWRDAGEPTVIDSLRGGADVVSFSGDKLLGGPQAGLILGTKRIIDKLRRHPMARALRVDKLTLAALEATLELHSLPAEEAAARIPTLAMLHMTEEALRSRAMAICAALAQRCPGETFTVATEIAYAGGGTMPAWPLPTWVVRWKPAGTTSVNARVQVLRRGALPVIPRIAKDEIVLDARTIGDNELGELAAAVRDAAGC